MTFSLPLVLAYLLGGIPFGLLVARAAGLGDIRKHGSGNIGATNVLRVGGFKVAVWVYILDIGKAVTAILLAGLIHGKFNLTIDKNLYLVITALVTVIGSVFPIYLKFKGGKGVNAALGSVVSLMPLETLIAFVVFFVTVVISKYISLGSILGALTLLTALLLERYLFAKEIPMIFVGLSSALVLLIIFTHRTNIGRILNGTENKFGQSKSVNKAAAHE